MSEQVLTPDPSETGPARPPWLLWASIILLFVIALLLAFLALPFIMAAGFGNALRLFFIVFGSLMPAIIYSSFMHGRLPILFAEYKQNLRRLGYPENLALYREKFEATFGQGPDTTVAPQLHPPILIACLLAAVGWTLVFFPAPGDGSELIPVPIPVAYGFLGAYILGLGSLVRQYVTDDLQLRYYTSLSYRFLVVFVLSWLITIMVPETTGDAATPINRYLLAAFAIGLVPTTGLRIAQRLGTTVLGNAASEFREDQPLSRLDGLNPFHEDRLFLEGIENMQNLASARVVDLMLKTRYPVERIVDWIDQALLHLHARQRIGDFQSLGMRTATDFLDAYEPAAAPTGELASGRANLARLFGGLADSADATTALTYLDTMVATLRRDPNFFHVRHWRDHEFEVLPEEIERARTLADLRLMQGIPDEAVERYNELLHTFPNQYGLLLYRGLAYAAQKDFTRAIEDFSAVIERGRAGEGARHAYVERGRALRQLEEYEAAARSYREAIERFDRNPIPEAHLELAFVQMAPLRQYDEAIENLQRVVALNFKEAEALSNLGLARHERWRQQGRPSETGQQELGQAQADLERAIRLKPDLIVAYLNLANVLEEMELNREAIRVLSDVLRRREALTAATEMHNFYRAHLHRGNLYLTKGAYQQAIEDYRAAIELDATDAAAFYNLGVALQQLERMEEAGEAFRDATRLNPQHLPAAQALGDVLIDLGLLDEAENIYARVLRLARQTNDRISEAQVHLSLGRLYRQQENRLVDTRRELDRAAGMAADLDDLVYTHATYQLGRLELASGSPETAVQLLGTAAELFDVLNDARAGAKAKLFLARAYRELGDKPAALTAARQARDWLATVYEPLNPVDAQMQNEIETELATQ
jgi:tetratricopeptide (TPR) repeat protein